MSTRERSATSGLGVLAVATLLLTPTNATAEVMADTRALARWAPMPRTNASSSLGWPTRGLPVLAHVPTSGDLYAEVRDFQPMRSTLAGAADQSLPERKITSLAATRIAGEDAAMMRLYRWLTAAVVQRGYRVTSFVLAGEDLVDSASEDVILEVYVDGLDDNEARLDLWEALSAEVEDAALPPLLVERLAIVVHGTTA